MVDEIPKTRYTHPRSAKSAPSRTLPLNELGDSGGLRCAKPNEPERLAEINELAIRASARVGEMSGPLLEEGTDVGV